MEGEWLRYAEAAERLNTTPEAVRQKAIRGRWQRTIGNDKRALIRLPDGWPNPVRTPGRPNKPDVRTLSESRTDTQLIKALEAHVETLKEQLAGAEARLAGERAQTEKATAAFSALAERLDALAADQRRRPWWRRLVSG